MRTTIGTLGTRLHDRWTYAALAPAVLLGQFDISPEETNAPGASGIQEAINGFAFYALLATAAGFLIGAAMWAVGGRIGNDYTAQGGKTGMVVAAGVAFLIGAASAILNFAFDTGSGA